MTGASRPGERAATSVVRRKPIPVVPGVVASQRAEDAYRRMSKKLRNGQWAYS
jgi:hypothetical protein